MFKGDIIVETILIYINLNIKDIKIGFYFVFSETIT